MPDRSRRVWRVALVCLALFAVSLSARWLYWQDQDGHMKYAHEYVYSQPRHYQQVARRILGEGLGAFVHEPYNDRGGARMLVHPPGYPMVVAGVFATAGDSEDALRAFQLALDALGVVLLFLVAVELVPLPVAAGGASLAALSPHLAYNALVLQPDSVSVFPLLVAALALVHALRRQSLALLAAVGVAIGLSCWVRSNAMLLPILVAALAPALFPAGIRLRAGAVVALAAVVTICPITIRNWVAFGRFVPISLGAGTTLMEGIGDFDPDSRFGMPATDVEVARAEAIWHGRPEYARAMWAPDGIDRDRDRFRRALGVVREHPFWFAGVMARRAALMARYNDDAVHGWPADTSRVPVLSAAPAFGHAATIPLDRAPAATRTPEELFGNSRVFARPATPARSAQLAVSPGTDCIVTLPLSVAEGAGAIEVVDELGRVLASTPVTYVPPRRVKRPGRLVMPEVAEVSIPFASGEAASVRLHVSADPTGGRELTVDSGAARVFELGQTPNAWLGAPRTIIGAVQKSVYRTWILRALVLLGVAGLLATKRRRELLVLAVVPVYFLGVQSALHTEYRYALAIHPFLFVLAAAGAAWLVRAAARAAAPHLAARALEAGRSSARFGPAGTVYTKSYVRPGRDGVSPATRREYEDGSAFFERFEGRWRLDDLAGLDVLDLGCGYGGRTIFYAIEGRARSIVGLEISERMAALANAGAARLADGADVRFVCGRAEQLPLGGDRFDVVVSYDVLEHVCDVAATLAECRRVLRPGGRLVALFPPYYGPRAHHLDFITTLPFLHHLFPAAVLVEAANRLIARAPELERAPFADLPRGAPLPTLNGTTERRFRQVVADSGLEVVELGLVPFAWGSGGAAKRAVSALCRTLLALPWPFTRDVFAGSIRCVLEKPVA